MIRLRHRLEQLTPEQRREWAASLTAEQSLRARYDWEEIHARDNQLPPPEFKDRFIWALITGRRFGKSRAAMEWVGMRRRAGSRFMGIMSKSIEDVEEYLIYSDAGLMNISPPWDMPVHKRGRGRGHMIWPATDAIPWETKAYIFSGEKPDQVRGAGMDSFVLDEYAHYKGKTDPLPTLSFSMSGTKSGLAPKVVIATSPLPTMRMKALAVDPRVVVTGGSLDDNAPNLAPEYVAEMHRTWDGTHFGSQEIEGKILDERKGALWTIADIAQNRGKLAPYAEATGREPLSPAGKRWMIWDRDRQMFRPVPDFLRISVGVDPAGSRDPSSGAIGIVVVALGADDHLYVIDDKTCGAGTHPGDWGAQAAASYWHWGANAVCPEVNFGGIMVEHTIQTARGGANVYVVPDLVASTGKQPRAHPYAGLSVQGRLHMLGTFPELESQLCTWVPGEKSPDRLDAMVWACKWLKPSPREEEPEYELVPTHPPAPWGAPRAPFQGAFS